MSQTLIQQHLTEAVALLEKVLNDQSFLQSIEAAGKVLVDAFKTGNKVISCGNGGSHCDAMHFAEELSGRYRDNRPALPAMAISDVSHITCVGNDYGFDHIFSRHVEAFGRPGDVLLAISTSGNSKNVIRAIEAAKSKGMRVIAMLGKDGGQIKGTADVEIIVPHFGFADRTQEIHIKVIHTLIHLVEVGMAYA
ncbi:D-sedoheptulose 7-phosphate isomerase [Leeia oryzae]|uniref:D-sedoheptulose 7-phosphate isomerase n=1 Tax=Leeia oryzae TaxID=356662 RepID=UPI00036E9507|nr:D-sedoheptulose 7-phosphate isomerase [Leeia oryzae]